MLEERRLWFYPLTFVVETAGVTIGRLDTETYADFPADGAALIQQLQAGLSLREAELWYQENYGETVDMGDFLATLHDLKFLREDEGGREEEKRVQVSLQWLGQALFSPLAWLLYSMLFATALYTLWRFPQLLPGQNKVFFSQSITLDLVILFFGQFIGLLFHEAYHVLAGRRLGLPSRLGIGYRLTFLVFETTLTGLWSVPRRSRYLPFLAGMLADLLFFSLLTVIAGATLLPNGELSVLGAVCLSLAFTTLLRFQWQFYFYLETDLYYVFTHATGCIDLQQTTRHYLRNLLFRCLGRYDKLEDPAFWHPRDRLIVRWYAPLYLLGSLLTIGVTLLVGIPVAFQFFFSAVTHVLSGTMVTTQFWDAAIFLLINGIQYLVIGILYWRRRQKRLLVHQKSIS